MHRIQRFLGLTGLETAAGEPRQKILLFTDTLIRSKCSYGRQLCITLSPKKRALDLRLFHVKRSQDSSNDWLYNIINLKLLAVHKCQSPLFVELKEIRRHNGGRANHLQQRLGEGDLTADSDFLLHDMPAGLGHSLVPVLYKPVKCTLLPFSTGLTLSHTVNSFISSGIA